MQQSFAFFNPWTSNLVTTILTFSLSCPLLGCRKTELGERCWHGAPVPRLRFWTRWGPRLPELQQVAHAWTPPRRTRAANAGLCAETWPSSGASPPPPTHTLSQSLPSSGFQELRRHQSTDKPSLWAGSCFTYFKFTFQNTKSIWAAKFTWKKYYLNAVSLSQYARTVWENYSLNGKEAGLERLSRRFDWSKAQRKWFSLDRTAIGFQPMGRMIGRWGEWKAEVGESKSPTTDTGGLESVHLGRKRDE